MAEYVQKTIVMNNFEMNSIIDYLQTNHGSASDGTFNIKEGGKIKIQPHEGKIEIMCNCNEDIIKELEGIIEQNE